VEGVDGEADVLELEIAKGEADAKVPSIWPPEGDSKISPIVRKYWKNGPNCCLIHSLSKHYKLEFMF